MISNYEPTDIEKKNLEAHVELCAERYKFLETKLIAVESKIEIIGKTVEEMHDMIHDMAEKRNNQLINWGVGIIGTLTVIIAYLLVTYALK